DAARGELRRDHGYPGSHRLQHLVLRAASELERCDRDRRTRERWTYVVHSPGHRDAIDVAERAHCARGVTADDGEPRPRARSANRGPGRAAEIDDALLVRKVIHLADEHDEVAVVGLAHRLEELAVDAVGEPIGPTGCAKAVERGELGGRHHRADVEARRETTLLALELDALEPVAERDGEVPLAPVVEPLLRVHVREIEDPRHASRAVDVVRDR